MERKKRKRKIRPIFKLLLVLFVGIFLFLFVNLLPSQEENSHTDPLPTIEMTQVHDLFYENRKETNPDYVGHLYFESGLVDQNLVQGEDNEKYLNMSWDLQESTMGAAYLDYRNNLLNQNLIVYGHYVYKDDSQMFSPLHELINEDNYEANKFILLQTDEETRKYVVTHVFYYEMDNPNLEYFHTEYSEEDFLTYIQHVEEKQFYDTNETVSKDNKLLTLQTCVRDRDDLRLIVIAKQIS